ncbi:MAG TPA: type II toxin-antitoxin system RelE/ParE family toxin [Flavisolibacter sp.]|nr:type II toxin-antitoxin system RelE/ParE family toxin [Flavisolibacter sp.]
MSYRTEFLKKARLELLEAWSWYEDKQPGLGDRFIKHIEAAIGSIELNPEYYKEKAKGYRQASVKIFPYLIIYKVHKRKKTVAIVSVFHTRRNPKKREKQN